ncbi:hypothetical protein [Bittarella massiliensis (ex Durand et al. 2017)]|uniref:hypothetical protein n=1 Tax=Bittarella massiliensis (ex Durand et al. 2017) TaxID=1720313 RepID=UPI00073F702C|nr:hypothetical protein [Bittarella massiliensis (ex Durand et al. 2017)]
MGHLGFSYIGLLWLAMLFVPNLYWVKRQPTGYIAAGENRLLVALERIGEAGVTCCALVFSDFNLRPLSPRSLWLALSLALMMAYEFWWVRYFRSGRTLRDFYRPLLGVPVAGATLPVLAFLALGIYGRVVWMVLAALVLGVGHIGIHLQHRREIEG